MKFLGPFLIAVFFAVSAVGNAFAFYEYSGDGASLDARGFFSLSAAHSANPDFPLLYRNASDQNYTATARLLAQANAGKSVGFEFNGLAYNLSSTSEIRPTPDVERSGALEWIVRDGAQSKSRIAIDRMNLRLSAGTADLTVGRQAINLATCFYFTPNDFFAPFAAQSFYRIYKPGVDAARLEIKLGTLSQLSIIGALGYRPDAETANRWSTGADRGEFVARVSTTFANFEWAAVAGKLNDASVYGGSLQGELFGWLGVRGEGHGGSPEQATEVAVGVERRFENGITVRYEAFHHGAGYGSPGQYTAAIAGRNYGYYLGMNYGALGLGYQFSPLLNGEMVAIINYGDGSLLAALYATYSLADNAEIAAGINLPGGEKSAAGAVNSEYGLYPASATVDLRIYF